MKNGTMTTEKNTPWAANAESMESREQVREKQLHRGSILFKHNAEGFMWDCLNIVKDHFSGENNLSEVDSSLCLEDKAFCIDALEEAMAYILHVERLRKDLKVRDEKQKIAALCKEKAPKNPEDLLAELDSAMDAILNNEGNPFEIAETIGAAQDLIAQGMLHKKLPVDDEPFELPNILRDVAEMLECGDETHPQNRQIALDAVWEVLDYLKWDKTLPAGKRISQESLSFVSEKLLEVDEILADLSKERMDESQTKLILALAENIWGIMASLFPHKDPQEA